MVQSGVLGAWQGRRCVDLQVNWLMAFGMFWSCLDVAMPNHHFQYKCVDAEIGFC